jgi:hypothetical protein
MIQGGVPTETLPIPASWRLHLMCGVMWGVAGVAGLLGLGRAAVAAQGAPGWHFPYDALMVGGTLLGAVTAGVSAYFLRKRRRWAYVAAVGVLVVALVGIAVGVTAAASASTDPHTADGPAYAVMGGAEVVAAFAVTIGFFVTPSWRRAVQLPRAAWYPDPAGVSRWRYWDGEHWTGHVA